MGRDGRGAEGTKMVALQVGRRRTGRRGIRWPSFGLKEVNWSTLSLLLFICSLFAGTQVLAADVVELPAGACRKFDRVMETTAAQPIPDAIGGDSDGVLSLLEQWTSALEPLVGGLEGGIFRNSDNDLLERGNADTGDVAVALLETGTHIGPPGWMEEPPWWWNRPPWWLQEPPWWSEQRRLQQMMAEDKKDFV